MPYENTMIINQQFMDSEKVCDIDKREALYDIGPFITYISHTFSVI
jgi:hypothetical protein